MLALGPAVARARSTGGQAEVDHVVGIDGLTVHAHFEVQVGTGHTAARADGADDGARGNELALLDAQALHVGVPGGDAIAVIDDHETTVAALDTGAEHDPIAGGHDGGVPIRREVEAQGMPTWGFHPKMMDPEYRDTDDPAEFHKLLLEIGYYKETEVLPDYTMHNFIRAEGNTLRHIIDTGSGESIGDSKEDIINNILKKNSKKCMII